MTSQANQGSPGQMNGGQQAPLDGQQLKDPNGIPVDGGGYWAQMADTWTDPGKFKRTLARVGLFTSAQLLGPLVSALLPPERRLRSDQLFSYTGVTRVAVPLIANGAAVFGSAMLDGWGNPPTSDVPPGTASRRPSPGTTS